MQLEKNSYRINDVKGLKDKICQGSMHLGTSKFIYVQVYA